MDVISRTPMPFLLNGYQFHRMIGTGAYSNVYEVYSEQYKQKFAAKVTEIDEETVLSNGTILDAELTALHQLDHPNIIRIYNYFIYENLIIIILEQCTGGTMQDEREKMNGVDTSLETRKHMIDILNGLNYCHNRRIAHRDIKPHNMYLNAYGRVVVGDFGLSMLIAKHQITDIKCGSYNYAAPEIFNNESFNAQLTDIWSLGVTFYQMVTGKLPWPESLEIGQRLICNVDFPENLDKKFIEIFSRMVNPNPNLRPSVEEIMNHSFFSEYNELPFFRKKISIYTSGEIEKVKSQRQIMPLSMLASKNICTQRSRNLIIPRNPCIKKRKMIASVTYKSVFDTF